jgi:hypothetical protein
MKDPRPRSCSYRLSLQSFISSHFYRPDSGVPFNPAPPGNEALARLFFEDEHGALEIDYVAVVEFFYPLVHPNCDEFTTDPDTGLRTVRHSFVNLAVLPDFFLNNEAVRRVLDLCP